LAGISDRDFHSFMWRGLVWLVVFGCLCGLARQTSIAGIEIVRGYNEGWNAYHTSAAMSGGTLYPHAPSLLFNNYPPLSFFVVGALGRLTGDFIIAGRIISLLSTLSIAIAIFACARRMAATAMDALFAATLFPVTLLATGIYVGIDDPQLFGHAVGCWGLFFALKEPRRTAALVASALLLTLAVFVKHMLLLQPLALVVWLARYDRKSAFRFAIAGIGFALLGLVLCHLLFGIDLISELRSARSYALLSAWHELRDFVLVGFAPLAATLFLFRMQDKYAALCALYASLALVIGTIFAGGAGVGQNALFDCIIACALGTALFLHHLRKNHPARKVLFAILCTTPLVVTTALKSDATWFTSQYWIRPFAEEAMTAKTDIAFIRNRPGPALCEILALCYWAGKAPQADAFNLTEAFRTHTRNEHELIRLLDARYFTTIELDDPSRFSDFPAIRAALARNYSFDHDNENGVFLSPRASGL
jgi:hypothetical protein